MGKLNKSLEGATEVTMGVVSMNENLDSAIERNETLNVDEFDC